MRISRKIGLSFFITFLLVIILGILSIYTLRQVYRGLSLVFAKDLPASRSTYQIAVSMEEVLSNLTNFLITGNENFKINYEGSYKRLEDSISELRRFITKDEEKALFEKAIGSAEEMNKLAENIFGKKKEKEGLFKDIRTIENRFIKNGNGLFDFEEKKMQNEKDFLLIQAQYIPASQLIMEARSIFLKILDGLAGYSAVDKEQASAIIMSDILTLEKSTRDYKNYYGYALSDNERTLATELIDLTGQIKAIVNSAVGMEKEIDGYLDSFLVKEKDFMETLDNIITIKKSGISSKLGVSAALTEDIPAIHNISKLEKDIKESWRIIGRYILKGDENDKNLYYQLRQNIDREIKDYGRHVRLRGTEKFLDEIVENDRAISEAIDSCIEIFEKKEAIFFESISIRSEIEKKIDELLRYKDSLIKEAKNPADVLNSHIPARWTLMRLRSGLSSASRLVMNYLSEQEAQYKDMYAELYFDMKKYLSRYRNLSSSEKDQLFIKEIEPGLDRFNTASLNVIDNHNKIMKETGWTLVKLEDTLKKSLDKAIEAELDQIEKNKRDLMNKIRVINTLIFFIIGVVAFIAVFVVFYTTNSITNPIHKLYSGAEIIGSGNLDHRLDIKTGDEIQDLAEGFNKMAGELKGLYTNLENKVKERTAQLAEANEALARTNKELDDFTYIVSHDLKEPLRGVKAFTKLLIEDYSGRLDNEAREHLRTISESGTRMTRLIEDLLNLSRIGRIKNIEPDIDLNEVLSDVKKNLAYSLEEKKVAIKIQEGFPKLTCDRIRTQEVFTNLISNAIKYSKKDARPVIEAGFSDKGDSYEFYVKDDGIGIEKEYYDRVFQIFQRLHAKGEYEGTGAGLTIVKKIVESHGGRIWLESKVGVGTTFYFTLPKIAEPPRTT